MTLYPVHAGEPRLARGALPEERVVGWAADGKAIWVALAETPVRVFHLDLPSGERKFWKQIMPPDLTGDLAVNFPRIAPDGVAYVYFCPRVLSDLYLAEGLK